MPPLNRLRTVAAYALLSCTIVACSQSGPSGQSQTLNSPDSKYQITVPSGWIADSGFDTGEIFKVRNSSADMTLVVYSRNKAEVAEGLTLDSWAETVRNGIVSKGGASELTAPVALTINGFDARQMEIKKDGQMGRCLMTLIYSPEHLNIINACTTTSKYEENKATLKQVSESLRGV